ncbi:MAG: putative polymerase sigma factor [Actinomycetia bacterium]|nr:putative polymerase sigma factor [Actinomycetes bacterium]
MTPDAFCDELRPRLVGSLVLFCGDRWLAEEIAQEALARAVERWGRVGAMASPQAWTYRTAFNLARSTARRRAAERRARSRLAGDRPPDLPDTSTAVAVRAAVAALPSRQRAAIVARFYAGLPVTETAEALGCAEGTVRALTAQAMVRLRTSGLLDEEEEDLDAHPA